MKRLNQFMAIMAFILCVMAPDPAQAQDKGDQNQNQNLSAAQLEQLVAPIALYPDSLLAQVLMASTYPLEVVEAARWVKANPNLKGDNLDAALQKQSWDPSVKSLAVFPQTLQMMNDKLDWTEDLGDAFLAQQKDVMAAVQRLRDKAQAQGNLKSGKEQTVKTEGSGSSQVIVIQSTQPDTVYVPVYNPTVVYGPWPYPAYPPYYWYPPGYVANDVIFFGLGVAAGYALWGDMDWYHDDIHIDVDHYYHYDHDHYDGDGHHHDHHDGQGGHDGHGHHDGRDGDTWHHNPDHRRGVPYHNDQLAKQFKGGDHAAARDRARTEINRDFRGHDGGPLHGGGGFQGGAGRQGGALAGHSQFDGARRNQGAFNDMNRGDFAHADRMRGAESRQIMHNHPQGGGFNSFHGFGGEGGHFGGGGAHFGGGGAHFGGGGGFHGGGHFGGLRRH